MVQVFFAAMTKLSITNILQFNGSLVQRIDCDCMPLGFEPRES